MYRFAKAAVNLSGQSARRVAVRHLHGPNGDSKAMYEFPLIIAAASICTGIWTYLITATGIPKMLTSSQPESLSGKKEE